MVNHKKQQVQKKQQVRDLTIKDIGRIAGVSPATVSMVLNDRPGLAKDTRDRVLKIIEAADYRPNLVARSLVKGRSDAIAMLITSPLNPIFPEMAAGVDEVLREHGYSLSIISTYDEGDVEANEIKKIRARGVDGVITSSALIDSECLKKMAQSGYPVVSVLRRIYNCDEVDSVYLDNLQGGYMAAEHLIRLGHTRIGIIKGPENTSTGKERFDGAVKAFADYGLPLTTELIRQGDYFMNSGYACAREFLAMPAERRPSAIYAGNDEMALGAYEALWDAGLRCPKDIALVGFNNVAATGLRGIEITTVSQRKQEMGRLAAKRLVDKIEKRRGYKKPYRILLEPELIIRKSCGYSLVSGYPGRQAPPRNHR